MAINYAAGPKELWVPGAWERVLQRDICDPRLRTGPWQVPRWDPLDVNSATALLEHDSIDFDGIGGT